MNWQNHIELNPQIVFGKPIIKNTRLTVDLILEKLAHGDSVFDLLEAYPFITKDDIFACLLYASESIKMKLFI